ncbi:MULTISPECIES: GDCCVxC domain-containing (seleno)protein [unclassified Afipia]|uniref:GDCCVxC domain-containing (seleno)protein n=1 Tax=unclassified Afipia TaxID=2642050 RepID=UPI001FCAA6A7|nr:MULTISPECIES: GDCCVxC domain-containing (seleno)protein [unclassified Afipia]
MQIQSTITCPHCGHRAVETMPTDACQFFYECKGCGVLLRPLEGHCCVFCSYGTNPCPSIQAAAHGLDPTTRCCAAKEY